MGIRIPMMIAYAKQMIKLQIIPRRNQQEVPKGHLAVYVGEIERKRFVVPLSYLKHPSFQDLRNKSEQEFGFCHPMGGLTIPCKEDVFVNLTSKLNAS